MLSTAGTVLSIVYAGPLVKLVDMLSASAPERLAEFRRDADALIGLYCRDNIVSQGYLLTRATKV